MIHSSEFDFANNSGTASFRWFSFGLSIKRHVCCNISSFAGCSVDLGQINRVVDWRQWRSEYRESAPVFPGAAYLDICTVAAALFTFHCLSWAGLFWPSLLLCIKECIWWWSLKLFRWPLVRDADSCCVSVNVLLHILGMSGSKSLREDAQSSSSEFIL